MMCRTFIPTSTSMRRNWRLWRRPPETSVRVLGIDCGTERTGWGVIESDGRRHSVLSHGVIVSSARDPLHARLKSIADGLRGVIAMHAPEAAAVEEVFYSLNVKTALKLAHVRGVALLAI